MSFTGRSESRNCLVERRGHGVHLHAHLVGQRPAGDVVGPLRERGIDLRLEQLLHQPGERLVHQDHPGVRLGRLMHFDALQHQLFHQQRGGGRVVLLARNLVGEGRLLLEFLDGVARRAVLVVSHLLAILHRQVEHRHVGLVHVPAGVGQAPPSALPRAGVEHLRRPAPGAPREIRPRCRSAAWRSDTAPSR